MLHRVESFCGRPVQHPKTAVREEENLDEVVPIQDQIENLRNKIALRKKYNRVLLENYEESYLGAKTILSDLMKETRLLRAELMCALRGEQKAVQIALRAHRIFQLALTGRNPTVAIEWLYDKLYDAKKRLNCLLHKLSEGRSKLEDSEAMVLIIEKMPRPGTLPWEVAHLEEFLRLEILIEDVKIKRETTMILNHNYYNIKLILKEEEGKYLPLLDSLHTQYESLTKECKGLQKMLDEAIFFRQETYKNLILTENEARDNRQVRKKAMLKTKRTVEGVLNENHARMSLHAGFDFSKFDERKEINSILDELKLKTNIVTQYQDRARGLVEVMRVSGVTLVPSRLSAVTGLGKRLKEAMEAKNKYRDVLIKQRDQLILILCHFRYTGRRKELNHNKKLDAIRSSINQIAADEKKTMKHLSFFGEVLVDLRLTTLSILAHLNEEKKHRRGALTGNLTHHLKTVYHKAKSLIAKVDHYQIMFEDHPEERKYGPLVRSSVPARFIRVSSPQITDESDEEDISSFKVPTRNDIKAKSIRFIHHAILTRGLPPPE